MSEIIKKFYEDNKIPSVLLKQKLSRFAQNGDIAAMTKEADIALYHSKENGRNQATVFTEDMRGEAGANV